MKPINIPGLSHLYLISEDGRVMSVRKMSFVKPSFNGDRRQMVYLTTDTETSDSKWYMIDALVMHAYGPPPPSRNTLSFT